MSDLLETRVFIERKPRGDHPYQRRGVGFVQVSKLGLRELSARLADHTLGVQAIRVLIEMAEVCDYENRVLLSQKDLASRLRMDQSDISKASNLLVDCGFLERMSHRGWYRISPRLLWNGSSRTLKTALEEREAA